MKAVFASAALFVAAVSAGYEGIIPGSDNVPLIYNDDIAYPATIYNGTQYNATNINGVAYNNSNEWPCLKEAGYVSILPKCADYCIKLALSQDGCDVDDFVCHCETLHSNKLDSVVVPCLTEGATATCDGEEIGELVNFVHGALCPYFEAVTTAYDHCPGSATAFPTSYIPTSTFTTAPAEETGDDCDEDGYTSDDGWGWEESSSSVITSTKLVTITTEIWETVTESSWTYSCDGPTSWTVGDKTFTVTEATTITVTDWPWVISKAVTTTVTSWVAAVETDPAWSVGSWAGAGSDGSSAAGAWAGSSAAAGAWATSTATVTGAAWGVATSTGGSWGTAPAQFTGAASNNKVAAGVAGFAAAAALLI